MRKQFVKSCDRMRCNAQEHIVEPGERVYLRHLTKRDKAAQDRRRSAAAVAAEKRPVITTYGQARRARSV
jgi:hypothetical protein